MDDRGIFSATYPGIIALTLCVLVGCNDASRSGSGGQAIAIVNSDELTIHQLNSEIAQMDISPDADMQSITANLKSLLVDRQLLVQQANKLNLQRRPDVVSAIERARSQLLAKAYLERVMDTAGEPTESDVVTFYTEHPELFSDRRRYDYLQLIVNKQTDTEKAAALDTVKSHLAAAKNIDSFLAWLGDSGFAYRVARMTQDPEDMQTSLFEVVRKLEPGQTTQVESDNGLIVLHLYEAHPDPVPEEKAYPLIREVLLEEKRKSLASADLDSLRAAATIKYFDEAGDTEAADKP